MLLGLSDGQAWLRSGWIAFGRERHVMGLVIIDGRIVRKLSKNSYLVHESTGTASEAQPYPTKLQWGLAYHAYPPIARSLLAVYQC